MSVEDRLQIPGLSFILMFLLSIVDTSTSEEKRFPPLQFAALGTRLVQKYTTGIIADTVGLHSKKSVVAFYYMKNALNLTLQHLFGSNLVLVDKSRRGLEGAACSLAQ